MSNLKSIVEAKKAQADIAVAAVNAPLTYAELKAKLHINTSLLAETLEDHASLQQEVCERASAAMLAWNKAKRDFKQVQAEAYNQLRAERDDNGKQKYSVEDAKKLADVHELVLFAAEELDELERKYMDWDNMRWSYKDRGTALGILWEQIKTGFMSSPRVRMQDRDTPAQERQA